MQQIDQDSIDEDDLGAHQYTQEDMSDIYVEIPGLNCEQGNKASDQPAYETAEYYMYEDSGDPMYCPSDVNCDAEKDTGYADVDSYQNQMNYEPGSSENQHSMKTQPDEQKDNSGVSHNSCQVEVDNQDDMETDDFDFSLDLNSSNDSYSWGFSDVQLNTLLSYGMKPWDDGAWEFLWQLEGMDSECGTE